MEEEEEEEEEEKLVEVTNLMGDNSYEPSLYSCLSIDIYIATVRYSFYRYTIYMHCNYNV